MLLTHGSEKCITSHFFFHEAADNYIDKANQLPSAKSCLKSPQFEEPSSYDRLAFFCSCMCRHLEVLQVPSFHLNSIPAVVVEEPMFSSFLMSQAQAMLEKLSLTLPSVLVMG